MHTRVVRDRPLAGAGHLNHQGPRPFREPLPYLRSENSRGPVMKVVTLAIIPVLGITPAAAELSGVAFVLGARPWQAQLAIGAFYVLAVTALSEFVGRRGESRLGWHPLQRFLAGVAVAAVAIAVVQALKAVTGVGTGGWDLLFPAALELAAQVICSLLGMSPHRRRVVLATIGRRTGFVGRRSRQGLLFPAASGPFSQPHRWFVGFLPLPSAVAPVMAEERRFSSIRGP
jgi:hypothetical protein